MNVHLRETQRKPAAKRQRNPPGRQVIEGGDGHGEHDGVPRIRIECTGAYPNGSGRLGHDRQVRYGITLKVAVVHPDRLEALSFGVDGVGGLLPHVAPRGKTEADPPGESAFH